MTSAKGGRTERLQIMVDADELAVIDDFRFKSRMPSRAAAVRELLRRGLVSAGRRPMRNSVFGPRGWPKTGVSSLERECQFTITNSPSG